MPTRDGGRAIVDFYEGRGLDGSGRTIEDVWRLGLDELEKEHDYIQWLFPLREPSRAQPQSPVLTEEAASAMRGSPVIRERLIRSARVMARFYGLEVAGQDGRWSVAPAAEFEERARVWLTWGNHNFLRQTRILRSLMLLGLEPLARAWFDSLAVVHREHARTIGDRTFEFWREAVRG